MTSMETRTEARFNALDANQREVSPRQNSQQPFMLINHRQTADLQLRHGPACLAGGGIGGYGVGVIDDFALVTFNAAHFGDFGLDRFVTGELVDEGAASGVAH